MKSSALKADEDSKLRGSPLWVDSTTIETLFVSTLFLKGLKAVLEVFIKTESFLNHLPEAFFCYQDPLSSLLPWFVVESKVLDQKERFGECCGQENKKFP